MAADHGTTVSHVPLAGGAVLITVRGVQPGPTVALLGGVHGDEDEGVLAVHRVALEARRGPLAGTLRAVAPANPLAWAASSRTGSLDGENLARCFPGDRDGGPTARLASAITSEVIAGSDLLIDLHSAGVAYRMPLFCGFSRGSEVAERSRRAAVAFGAPLIWTHPATAPGRSLSAATDLGIPSIYAECSGGGGIRAHELAAYVRGVQRVMSDLGMRPAAADAAADTATPRWVYGSGDLDAGAVARHHGFFVSTTGGGEAVAEGAEIGRLYDFGADLLEVVRAPAPGVVMFLRRRARVLAGDVLYVLARLEDDGE